MNGACTAFDVLHWVCVAGSAQLRLVMHGAAAAAASNAVVGKLCIMICMVVCFVDAVKPEVCDGNQEPGHAAIKANVCNSSKLP